MTDRWSDSLKTTCSSEAERCPACAQKLSYCLCLRRWHENKHDLRHPVAHATHAELRWRHNHWWARRERVIAAMKAASVSPRKMEAFENCGACAHPMWSEIAQRRKLKASYCKSRHCEPCMRSKANLLAHNLTSRLEKKATGKYRFVTITKKHSAAPLRGQVEELIKQFRRLRSDPCWKNTVHGGAFTIEVKRYKKGDKHSYDDATYEADAWHPHIHAVVDAEWLDQAELRRAWFKITTDSYIVHVKLLDSPRDAAHYVSKYVSKGTSPSVWNDEADAREWINAIKGTRMCSTIGEWRGMKLLELGADPGDWKDEGPLESWIAKAAEGDQHATFLLRSLRPATAGDPIDWQ